MFAGKKEWIMWDLRSESKKIPMWNEYYRGKGRPEGSDDSPIDGERVDLKRWPEFGKARWRNTTIEKGDCLYLPAHLLHYVRSWSDDEDPRIIALMTMFQTEESYDPRYCQDVPSHSYLSDYDVMWGEFPGSKDAAQAAAQAATALQRFTDRRDSSGKFSEAGKVVRQADPYGTDDIEQDIAKWTEFYDNFRAWLFYADKEYEVSLDHLENNTATPVDMSTMDLGQQERSKQLYSILIGSLRGRPLRILKGVAGRNGFEAWRQLLSQYQPRTRARSISMLSALMNFPQFNKSQTIIEQIQGFERLRNEYRRSSGVDLADDVSLSILVVAFLKHCSNMFNFN
eukprot:symbB.v1.2.041042.t1/scaffold7772.1/size9363/1